MNRSTVFAVLFMSIFIAGLVVGYIRYFTGKEYELYDEAKQLEAQGDLHQAHDKIVEALSISPLNRKILAYKADLFLYVNSDTKLQKAKELYDEAVKAMNKVDYETAAEKLEAANNMLYDLTTLYKLANSSSDRTLRNVAKSYNIERLKELSDKAEELQKLVSKDIKRFKDELPSKYYDKAVDEANQGYYEKAYNTLSFIREPNDRIKAFKEEISNHIGTTKYNNIEKGDNVTSFAIKDSIWWLEKVSDNSPNYIEARVKISKLNKRLGELDKEYYEKAINLTKEKEYEKAYNVLSSITNTNKSIEKLQSELSFQVGVIKLSEINKTQNPQDFLIINAMSWFSNVDKDSDNYPRAQEILSQLNDRLSVKSKKNSLL